MDPNDFGVIELVDADRVYPGSRFSEVREAVFANPYQKVWGAPGEPPLPFVMPTFLDMLRVLWRGRHYLTQAAERSVDARSDLRWGPDGKGFRRIVHPWGVVLTGLWEITEESDYTGYFQKGSKALIVARYSNGGAVQRGKPRGQGIAGKLFPTTDPNHKEPLQTANFFTIDDIVGASTRHINDVDFVNAPNVTLSNDWSTSPIVMTAGVVFAITDKDPTERQLHEIAELGKPRDLPTRAPRFMRLKLTPDHPRIEGEGLDSRDELLAMMFDKGDPMPKRKIVFAIEVTEDGEVTGITGFKKGTFRNWRRIGAITFDNAVVSYNGDRVLHFHHPNWRIDRNDPATRFRPAPQSGEVEKAEAM
ncbi:hypothetical protein [Methylocystis sp. B8]|uniref:hypothetical protein n=1 Tax=Methylocystis sp. B8 TaxID=544938 RepID=UPI0010FD2F3F|nr:hypothetical protein [Methylocystis sp. B8]TLG77923.1 hypothetical protein FEV16_04950 [Methylocystis sp. B8]